MSAQPYYFECAGCHTPTRDSHLQERGVVGKRRYCVSCVEKVDAILSVRDSFHTEAARQLQTDLLVLVEEFQKENPGFELPHG